ncbi:MAG: glycosyltransferase family 4 protein [Deltaproteobacteria bacterium]
MNICLVSREYPPETAWGGISSYTYNLARGLARSGHSVHVVTLSLNRDSRSQEDNINVHRLFTPSFGTEHLFPFSMVAHSMKVAGKLRELVEGSKIDIVEAPEWYAESLCYGLWRKTPLVVRFHAPRFLIERYSAPRRRTVRTRVIFGLEKFAALRADSMVTPCTALQAVIAREYRISPERIAVIPNPIDIPDEEAGEDGPAGGFLPYVLYAGRLERLKGVHVLAQAIPLVARVFPEVKFIFAGSDTMSAPDNGSMRNYLFRLNKDNPNIIFAGQCGRRELYSYYRSASLCVVPSLWETFPYVALEAMAFGRPIVASRVGGMLDIIREGRTGFLVPPNDPVALSRGIIKLLKDQQAAAEMGKQGKELLDQKYSFEKIIRAQVEHYHKVIATFPHR